MPSALNTLVAKEPLLSRDFESLTNIDEIRECLRLLDEEETRIDASLDTMLAQENKLDLSLNTLAVLRPQLGHLKSNSSRVIHTVDKTSRLAEVISDKVRQLDQEQSRAREAIKYVEDVQELKYCVASLQEAMQRKEYDEAAVLLQRASKIDDSILNGSLAEFTVVSLLFFLDYTYNSYSIIVNIRKPRSSCKDTR
ncbi:uncharacterized protein EV154DRAFT_409938 [Mucor mucedo]|uniref:uncharacterized protein n=1 Tax=Mucor mucedo TaxID=29922 RepID=UPI00221EA14E|nr:uncharacterized protein EV154DRAFT_409938 [Mucor mucedo]KAI7897430.1 hypothetical protein EV154DRAFT_409938 [Mucor mucedo]